MHKYFHGYFHGDTRENIHCQNPSMWEIVHIYADSRGYHLGMDRGGGGGGGKAVRKVAIFSNKILLVNFGRLVP